MIEVIYDFQKKFLSIYNPTYVKGDDGQRDDLLDIYIYMVAKFFFQEHRVPILKAGCDHFKYVPCKTDPKSTPMYDFKLMMLPTLQPIQQSSHSCDIDGQDMSASLLRSGEQRWPSRQTLQATMGHSLGAPPMCVVAVLFKVCERNSRSLRTTTVPCTYLKAF